MSSTPTPHSGAAFFYGTLMAPSVLKRVTNRQTPKSSQSLRIQPAILPGFRRLRVKHADYPAIIPARSEENRASTSTSGGEPQVRGTYVTGLGPADIRRLDAFEGSEYARHFVRVRLLPPETGVPEALAGKGDGMAREVEQRKEEGDRSEEKDEWVTAETYVWMAPRDELEEQEWDFEEFVRERLWLWAGGKGDVGFDDAARVEGEDEEEIVDSTRGRSVRGGEFERKIAEEEKQE